MRWHWSQFAILLGGCLTMAAAQAALPQTTPANASSAHSRAAIEARLPDMCFSYVFYHAMPGKSNYCLGLRDWKNGHYHEALEFLKLAAGWGNKSAQYTLGLIYYGGHHVPAQPALGLAWLMLANERHSDPLFEKVASSALHWATPAQRQQANQWLAQLRPKYGDKVAATRAWHELQRWKFDHGPFASGCVNLPPAQAWAFRKYLEVMRYPQMSPGAGANGQQREAATFGVGCVSVAVQRVLVKKVANKYFEGWMGTVSVGPLKTVPAPAASSRH